MAANVHKKTDSAAWRGLLLSRADAFFAPRGLPAACRRGLGQHIGDGLAWPRRVGERSWQAPPCRWLCARESAEKSLHHGGLAGSKRRWLPFGDAKQPVLHPQTGCFALPNGRFGNAKQAVWQVPDIQVVVGFGIGAPPFAKNHDTNGDDCWVRTVVAANRKAAMVVRQVMPARCQWWRGWWFPWPIEACIVWRWADFFVTLQVTTKTCSR